MATVYSTHDVHPRDSVAYWVEVVTHAFVKCVLSPDYKSGFRASVRTSSLGALSVSSYECDPNEITRTARDISRARSDDYFVCLQMSGRPVNIQGDREIVVHPGSFFLLDPQRPFTGRSEERGRLLTISVPRPMLEARVGNTAQLASRTMDGRRSTTGLAFGFLTMLPERIEELDDAAGPRVVEQTLDLIALAFTVDKGSSITLSSPRAVALSLLKSAIEARLHEPGLKPAAAAAAAGISVRYANALQAEQDTCLERHIIERRLDRCRRALEDPRQERRMIGEIAYGWGFSDVAHFGRRFKAAFGCSPDEYRRRANKSDRKVP